MNLLLKTLDIFKKQSKVMNLQRMSGKIKGILENKTCKDIQNDIFCVDQQSG
jgi:hypothetical protein